MFDTTRKLRGKKIAILATDGFEESELLEPKKALETAGAQVHIVSLAGDDDEDTHSPEKTGMIKSWKENDWGIDVSVDRLLDEVSASDYDALMLPGGVINADKIRSENLAVQFVSEFVETGKPIAAICHAAWVLIESGQVQGRHMTSWPSLRTDLENAGAHWTDEEVIVDDGWVTSRKPDDLPAFNEKMIEEFSKTQSGLQNRSIPLEPKRRVS